MRVGLADRAGHGDRRVPGQRLLDLGGIDVVAAADDQILRPPGDEQVALVVHPPQIAGPQIAAVAVFVEQSLVLGGLGIGPAVVDAGIVDADLGDLVDLRLRAVLAQDPHVGIGERDPDRADLLEAADRVDRDEAGALRQAVAFHDLDPNGGLELLEELDRQRRGARERVLHRRDVGVDRALHQGADRGRHGDQERDPVLLAELPEIVEDPLPPVALRRGEDDMRAGARAGHEDDVHR